MTGKDDESVAVPQLRPVPRRALVTDLSLARWLLVIILAASAYFFYGFIVPVLAATVIAFASWPILLYLDRRLGLNRILAAVSDTRGGIGKRSMIHNDATPNIEVDPEPYEVRADGVRLTCEPADVLPMAQRYFLF